MKISETWPLNDQYAFLKSIDTVSFYAESQVNKMLSPVTGEEIRSIHNTRAIGADELMDLFEVVAKHVPDAQKKQWRQTIKDHLGIEYGIDVRAKERYESIGSEQFGPIAYTTKAIRERIKDVERKMI
jgi:hypothetical protein